MIYLEIIIIKCPTCGERICVDTSRTCVFCQDCGERIVFGSPEAEHRSAVQGNKEVFADKAERIKVERTKDRVQKAGIRKNKIKWKPLLIITLLLVTIGIGYGYYLIDQTYLRYLRTYREAEKEYNEKQYDTAIMIFESLGDFKDSREKTTEVKYDKAVDLFVRGEYKLSAELFETIPEYLDSEDMLLESRYYLAETFFNSGEYEAAAELFEELGDYRDSEDRILEADYEQAKELSKNKKYYEAVLAFSMLNDYKDSRDRIIKISNSKCSADVLLDIDDRLDRLKTSNPRMHYLNEIRIIILTAYFEEKSGKMNASEYRSLLGRIESVDNEEAQPLLFQCYYEFINYWFDLGKNIGSLIQEFIDKQVNSDDKVSAIKCVIEMVDDYELIDSKLYYIKLIESARKIEDEKKRTSIEADIYNNLLAIKNPADTIFFGKYMPEGSEEAIGNPITWKIIEEDDEFFYLLSADAIKMAISRNNTIESYEESNVHQWLNGYFFETSFDEMEKQFIVPVFVKNNYLTKKPEDEMLIDNVFIPDYSELCSIKDKNKSIHFWEYTILRDVSKENKLYYYTSKSGTTPKLYNQSQFVVTPLIAIRKSVEL